MDHIANKTGTCGGRDRFLDEGVLASAIAQYEIGPLFTNHLRRLLDYKIVIIADDSGSMTRATSPKETRWTELRKFITTVFSITQSIKNSFVDVHFLNRGSILGIERLDQITLAFETLPDGGTPLVAVLEKVLEQPYFGYKGRLIIIATDGEPNTVVNGSLLSDIGRLHSVLKMKRTVVDYVTFLACTDDDDALAYLNNWDKQLVRLDVMDDYPSEKKEVLSKQGRSYHFTYGDYVVKTMVGSIIASLDQLDETRLQTLNTSIGTTSPNDYNQSELACCTII